MATVIQKCLCTLIRAVSDCVQPVSDQCLAKGLIPDSVYDSVRESGETSKDKARTLILAVKKSTETDRSCLEIFLSALNEELPLAVKDKLLQQIRDEILTQNKGELEAPDHSGPTISRSQSIRSQAVVPISDQTSLVPNGVLENREFLSQQNSLITKLEDAIRTHEQSRLEQALMEKRLKSLSEESERLKGSQRDLNQKTAEQDSRLSANEKEMAELKEKLATLKPIVEEHSMHLRRSRAMMTIGGIKLVEYVLERSQQQIQKVREEYTMALQEKEMEYKEAEAKIERNAQEKIRISELESKIALQAKDVQIKDLQLELHKKSPLKRSHTYNNSVDFENSSSSATKKPRELPPYMAGTEFALLTSQHHKILFKQLSKHARDWREIAANLGFTLAEMGNIEGRPLLQDKAPGSWLSTILEEWLHWRPGDARRSLNYATLEDLKAALKKAKLTETARTLSASIKMPDSNSG